MRFLQDLLYSPVFWKHIMSDGINGKALGEIAEHICWENEDLSRKIIKEVCNGINLVDYDRFDFTF